jgi:uncharacterized membrane protein
MEGTRQAKRNRPENRAAQWHRVPGLLNEAKIARVLLVLILGTMGSVPLVFLTPPFQVPDEVNHFYRAYQLSEFRIRAEVQNGVAGGTLPDSLPLLVQSSVYTADGIFYPATPAPFRKTLSLAMIPLDPSNRRFIAFPRSAFYSPLPYLPQMLGIALGRAFGSGPLCLFYLGRLFNCLAAVGLLGLAVRAIPVAEELVILIGLLPMSLYLYASLSPDAAVIACALLFTALSSSASVRGDWRTRDLVMAAAAGAVFCSVKPVYAPLLLAGLVPGVFRPGQAARAIRSHLILLAAVAGVTAAWLLFARTSMTSQLSGTHPATQLSLVLHHPMLLLRAMAQSLGLAAIIAFYAQTVGVFGWLNVALRPGVVYLLPLANFVLVCRSGFGHVIERSKKRALWWIVLPLTCALVIMVAAYLMWAQVGQDNVTGLQGRYLIPLLCLAGLAVIELTSASWPPARRWHVLAATAALVVVEIVAMDATIVRAFHVF